MRLFVIGSGSSGNCYLLENETECLVIEAGLPYSEVKKAIDFQTRKIVGVVVSHKHQDHSGYLKDYYSTGIKIFKPYEDFSKVDSFGGFEARPFPLTDKQGKFMHTNHDGSECQCFGFHISHKEMGIFIYASDAELIKWVFKGAKHFLVEANYSTDLVERDSAKYEHQITGHMNIDTTCRFLKKNNNSNLKTVTLCHLSADCGNAEDFKARAEEVVDCDVYIAKKGLEINLDLIPDWVK